MLLAGKKGLVLNVTNKNSIGWAIAAAAHEHGAEVGVGAQNERMREKVEELVQGYERMKVLTVDFAIDEDLARLREDVATHYGKIDFLVHSAAYAPREALLNPFIETKREDFLTALNVSAYSLVAVCQALEPLMNDDGSVMALSYLGSTRAATNYNVMGVAKAALESCVRYLSVDLGQRGIRVNTLSPGPVNTVAARGVKDLIGMIDYVHERAPLKRAYGQEECGLNAVYLMSDLSRGVTGQIIFIDSGYNISAL